MAVRASRWLRERRTVSGKSGTYPDQGPGKSGTCLRLISDAVLEVASHFQGAQGRANGPNSLRLV
jgi:hypothetical protein